MINKKIKAMLTQSTSVALPGKDGLDKGSRPARSRKYIIFDVAKKLEVCVIEDFS